MALRPCGPQTLSGCVCQEAGCLAPCRAVTASLHVPRSPDHVALYPACRHRVRRHCGYRNKTGLPFAAPFCCGSCPGSRVPAVPNSCRQRPHSAPTGHGLPPAMRSRRNQHLEGTPRALGTCSYLRPRFRSRLPAKLREASFLALHSRDECIAFVLSIGLEPCRSVPKDPFPKTSSDRTWRRGLAASLLKPSPGRSPAVSRMDWNGSAVGSAADRAGYPLCSLNEPFWPREVIGCRFLSETTTSTRRCASSRRSCSVRASFER